MNNDIRKRIVVLSCLVLIALPISSITYQKNHSLAAVKSVRTVSSGRISDQQTLYDVLPAQVIQTVDVRINHYIGNDTTASDNNYHVKSDVSTDTSDGPLSNTYLFTMGSDGDDSSFTVNVLVLNNSGIYTIQTYINGTLQKGIVSDTN